MADEIELKISGPISIVAEAASRIVVAIFENDSKHRETMSPAMRDRMDIIKEQAYWDFRGVLQKLKLVDPVVRKQSAVASVRALALARPKPQVRKRAA